MTTIVGHIDVCPECVRDIDPESHVYNPQTGEKYCSGDCWAKAVFA